MIKNIMPTITDLYVPPIDTPSRHIWREFLDKTLTTVRSWKWNPGEDESLFVAAIIEPRNHCDLEYVIRNANHYLGSKFKLILLHGTKNVAMALFLQSILSGLYLKQLDYDNLCGTEYNQILTSYQFWEYFPTGSKVVIFQTDSIILRPGIEQFFEYDYVGAPWRDGLVGNGGFSLRDRNCMMRIIQQFPFESLNEDGWFASHVPLVQGKLPSTAIAYEFANETTSSLNPLGVHNIASYLSQEQVSALLKYQ
jgi:hypothetical protein